MAIEQTSRSPFKFLDSYTKEDGDIFFGRDSDIEELYERAFESNLILLYGASGTGKTSLINSGLANQFESTEWLPIFIRRTDNILADWEKAIHHFAVKPIDASWPLAQKARSLYLDYFKTIYFVFDQFEELFIFGDEAEQRTFFEALAELVEQEENQWKALISMREEYLAHLSNFELILPRLFENRQRIERMNRVNLQQVVGQTAHAFGIRLENEEESINMIIDNIKDPKEGVELANLQIYLDKLYRNDLERRGREDRPIIFDHDLIANTRQLEDVLSDFLEEQLTIIEQELKAKEKNSEGLAMDLLFTLVTDEGTKRNLPVKVLKEQLMKRNRVDEQVLDYCIRRFNELRILRIMGEEFQKPGTK